jgi:hypothetical protein
VILQFKFFNTEQQETALFQTEIDLSGLVAVAESKREMIREKVFCAECSSVLGQRTGQSNGRK